MEDYTRSTWGEIIAGSRWPPAADPFTIAIANTGGWPPEAASWTWEVVLSRSRAGGTPDLTLAASATLEGDVLTLTFHAPPQQPASLPGAGRRPFFVAVRSTDGSGTVSYYACVQGYAWVREPAGQGS